MSGMNNKENVAITNIYISPQGNDLWSGTIADINADSTDGPVATIAKAKSILRTLKRDGELQNQAVVWLRGGTYNISGPIMFEPEDSMPVTFAAYPGEQPVISGGKIINGWNIEQINGLTVWTRDIPEVASGQWYFRSMYVNEQRRCRARLPKKGYYWMEDVPDITIKADLYDVSSSFICAEGDVKKWDNLNDVEIVVLHYWTEERMPISTFDERTRLVTSERSSVFALKDDFNDKFAKYYVDNVFEALSEPGEWYLNRKTGKLYYIPMPGEEPENTQVVIPVAQQFLKFEGNIEENRFIEFIRFKGIKFSYTEWEQPDGKNKPTMHLRFDPKKIYAAVPQAAYNVSAAISMKATCNCVIEDCTLSHIGGYGVELLDGCMSNRISGNEITDMGAGGIKVGSVYDKEMKGKNCRNIINDNHIHDGGHVNYSGVGITCCNSSWNNISHNHIHDLYYTGISCGWLWGYDESLTHNNLIEKNYIHHLGKSVLSDMGGIYTLGVQPGTILRGNLVHDIDAFNYGGWGIYMDEGSSHILIENNICYNTNSQTFNQHYGRENTLRNNIFAFGRQGMLSNGRQENHNQFNFYRNILVSDNRPMFVAGYACNLKDHVLQSDMNLFWDISGKEPFSGNWGKSVGSEYILQQSFTMEEWKGFGYDLFSKVADPMFEDLKNFNFTLRKDSPAFDIGFEPIDISDVGPRK